MTILDRRGFRLWFATFVLFTGIAGDFWRDAISWYGYGVIVALVVAGATLTLIHNRRWITFRAAPIPLIGFLGFAVLSIAWSDYAQYTSLGAFAQLITTGAALAVAVSLSWDELLVVLGYTFRLVLGLSYLFELVVAAIIRHPIFPVWVVPDDPAHPPKLLYWSRDLLFSAGKIQGIVGNSSLLAMAALLGLIVFAVQLVSRSVRIGSGIAWLVVAFGTIALTRSATIILALAVVVVVAIAAIVVRNLVVPRAIGIAYATIAVVVVALAVLGVVFRTPILHLLGKSSDFTGRIGIWQAVIHLAQQRPAFGWGWLSYWVPWIEPFKSMDVVRGGVQVLHAHDAWLDVWLQVGIVGLVIFSALALSTLVRSWLFATDRVITLDAPDGRLYWVALVPLLMFVAQLVQSIAESRMLLEGGWMLLVIWAVKTKLDAQNFSDPATKALRA